MCAELGHFSSSFGAHIASRLSTRVLAACSPRLRIRQRRLCAGCVCVALATTAQVRGASGSRKHAWGILQGDHTRRHPSRSHRHVNSDIGV